MIYAGQTNNLKNIYFLLKNKTFKFVPYYIISIFAVIILKQGF